jgi:serine protease inhibitor
MVKWPFKDDLSFQIVFYQIHNHIENISLNLCLTPYTKLKNQIELRHKWKSYNFEIKRKYEGKASWLLILQMSFRCIITNMSQEKNS